MKGIVLCNAFCLSAMGTSAARRWLSRCLPSSCAALGGNPPHHGTVAKLREVGIPVIAHRARQVRRAEYGDWDHIVYMDAENARGLHRIFGKDPDGKISRLLDWTDRPGDVADPWYTGNFDATHRDILAGCTALLEQL